MAPSPLVSCILLTTHPRRAQYLPDALRSYRQQTYASRELIVVNDGAPLTAAAADVRVVNLPRRDRPWTIGEKRNVGVRAAAGEYLATWDDDDVSLPPRLAEQVAAALAWRADVVRADGMYIADASLSLAGRCQRSAAAPVMASALIRREAAVRAGGYPVADYLEDAEMIQRITLLGLGHVATLPGCRWYVLRRHSSNVTLDAGERADEYIQCAACDPETGAAVRAIQALQRGPGADDVREGA